MISFYVFDKNIDISPTTNGTVRFFTKESTIVGNFLAGVKYAIEKEEEFIHCIFEFDGIACTEINIYEVKNIYDLGISSFYTSALYDESINISNIVKLISWPKRVNSFIISNDDLKYILEVLHLQWEIKEIEEIAQKIIPYSILFTKNVQTDVEVRQRKINIISPCRNVSLYIEDYLESILVQEYSNFHIYIIDDCSTDDTFEKIPENNKITKSKNTSRKYALENILAILNTHFFEEDDIICFIDPDDMLSHRLVLDIINSVYTDDNILFSYSRMKTIGNFGIEGARYTRQEFELLRFSPWRVSHIRTFRYKLYKKYLALDPTFQYLKNEYGAYLRMPYDMALFFPLLEIATLDGVKFIPAVLYNYRLHGNNDHIKNRDIQYKGELTVRRKPRLVITNMH